MIARSLKNLSEESDLEVFLEWKTTSNVLEDLLKKALRSTLENNLTHRLKRYKSASERDKFHFLISNFPF
jgi:hypothetical protein